jgi:hypothetical protein
MARLRRLLAFPLYVRQTIPAVKFPMGHRRPGRHHYYPFMGQPLPPLPRHAQLRNVS